MQKLQHLELSTLEDMLARHQGYYTKMLSGTATEKQLVAAQKIIGLIEEEISTRKQADNNSVVSEQHPKPSAGISSHHQNSHSPQQQNSISSS